MAILIGIFLFILLTGVGSMHLLGGATGDLSKDFYLVLSLFGFEGDWVFETRTNGYLKVLVFIAPLLTVLGIIELFTRKLVAQGLQGWTLMFIRKHVVILGLSAESYLLIKSLRKSLKKREVVVIDQNPDPILALKCRKLGVPIVARNPTTQGALARAKISRAALAVSFVSKTPEAISLVFSVDKIMRKEGSRALDLWLNFEDAEFGRRLGDYLKFANLSNFVHPRFFNLNEVAARRLVRQHPPDLYADVLGHEQLHLAVYGFGNFAFEVIEEMLLQTSSSFSKKPRVSILTPTPKEDRDLLFALCPQISEVADVTFTRLRFFPTGLSHKDYKKIPEEVTMHLVCLGRADTSAAVALSLRHLLLSPPPEQALAGLHRLNAPIFVRLSRTRGIAQLLESHFIEGTGAGEEEKRGDIPDGIFAFGMMEDLLAVDQDNPMVPTAVDSTREKAAKYLHFSYIYDLKTLKKMFDDVEFGSHEVAQDWEDLGPVFRESCRQEADHIWGKARLIRHRLMAKTEAPEGTGGLTTEEKKIIAVAEHARWLTERRLAGWVYDKKRVDEAKRHNLLRPWEELSEVEAKIDLKLAERINAAADHAGLVLKRELVIGVVGHRFVPGRPFDEEFVKNSITLEIDKLLKKHPDRAPVLMTHLADGADTIAAEVALEKGIPFIVPLPLPFEIYRRDFLTAEEGAVNKFLDLISKAELYFELPQKFGTLVDLAKEKKSGKLSKARENQYALAGAYIVERADELIAVWDGKEARGTGGTADVVAWRKAGKVPKKFQSRNLFNRHTKIKPPILIKPTK